MSEDATLNATGGSIHDIVCSKFGRFQDGAGLTQIDRVRYKIWFAKLCKAKLKGVVFLTILDGSWRFHRDSWR